MLYEYPFKSKSALIDGVRLHYLDEGEGPVIWMMHGNPTWSYLYRKMIPPLVEAGYRCFVPDLMGHGLSDKPLGEEEYSIQRHVKQMTALIEHLGLENITTVGQDWGGPITLRYAIENKHNIRALVILNTIVQRNPSSNRERREKDIITGMLPPGFTFLFKNGAFSSFLVRKLDVFRKFVWMKWRTGNPSKMLGAGFRRPVDRRAIENYMAPNNRPEHRASLAVFPKLIPDSEDHPNADYIDQIRRDLERWDIPVLVAWADGDMAWKVDEGKRIAAIVPNGQFYLVKNAGHYLQEDAGEEIAQRMVGFLKDIEATEISDQAVIPESDTLMPVSRLSAVSASQ